MCTRAHSLRNELQCLYVLLLNHILVVVVAVCLPPVADVKQDKYFFFKSPEHTLWLVTEYKASVK